MKKQNYNWPTTWLLIALATAALLQPRIAMATTRTVSNRNDSGPNSLRDTIAASAANDTITFAVTGTIILTSGELAVARNLTILGPAGGITVSGNNASRVFNISSGITVNISNLTISGGHTRTGAGGGIYNNGGTLTINNCYLSGNSSDYSGSGIGNGGSLTINNCTLSGNGGGYFGGGIYNEGSLTINNCTLSGNSAFADGGGIYQSDSSGATLIRNTVIAGNLASYEGPDVFGHMGFGVTASRGHNLVGKTDGSSGWVGSDLTGTIASPLDPQLGPLQDNGGPTLTMALLPSSAAIDAGDDAVINTITTDQRGRPRKSGVHVDIGAYELNPPVLSIARSAGEVVLSWPTYEGGYLLQARSDLLSGNWSDVPGTSGIVLGQITVTNSATAGNKFYRLRSP